MLNTVYRTVRFFILMAIIAALLLAPFFMWERFGEVFSEFQARRYERMETIGEITPPER